MAELIWTEPALQDLSELADYIALENQTASKKLVQAVLLNWLQPSIQDHIRIENGVAEDDYK